MRIARRWQCTAIAIVSAGLLGCPGPFPPFRGTAPGDGSRDAPVDSSADADAGIDAADGQGIDAEDSFVVDATDVADDADAPIEASADGGCPGSLTNCSGVCLDLNNDAQHCGTCRATCASGTICVDGGCTCPAPRFVCAGTCYPPDNITCAHCGSCGNQCPSGSRCVAGACYSGLNCLDVCGVADCALCRMGSNCP